MSDSAKKMREALEALTEPEESDAYDNLESALIDIKRLSANGKPTDHVCIRTIERVQEQILKATKIMQAALTASGTKSDGGGEVADPQKPEIGSVEFRGKKSLGALPGSCAPTADATALPSSDGVAPIPSDLKRGEIFSFDDGLLTIKISGYGQEDGWGTLAFHERQIEIDADGFHCVEIAPSELREIRDFLNRVTKPGPSDPIPSQPDERESIARLLTAAKLLQQNAIGCATNHHGHDCELNGLPGWLADTKKDIDAAEDAILAMQAERRGAKQDIVDLAKDLVALWTSPKISGLPRSERNAAIEDTRNAMIEAVGNLARSSVGSEQGSSNSEVTGSSPVAPATNAAVAQSAEQPFCKGTVSGSSPDGGTNTQPAPIAGLEPVAWRYRRDDQQAWQFARVLSVRHGETEPLYTAAQLEAHAAEQVRPLVEALEGLIEAVELDADEGLEGIGSYTGARLTDAKNAIRARGQV